MPLLRAVGEARSSVFVHSRVVENVFQFLTLQETLSMRCVCAAWDRTITDKESSLLIDVATVDDVKHIGEVLDDHQQAGSSVGSEAASLAGWQVFVSAIFAGMTMMALLEHEFPGEGYGLVGYIIACVVFTDVLVMVYLFGVPRRFSAVAKVGGLLMIIPPFVFSLTTYMAFAPWMEWSAYDEKGTTRIAECAPDDTYPVYVGFAAPELWNGATFWKFRTHDSEGNDQVFPFTTLTFTGSVGQLLNISKSVNCSREWQVPSNADLNARWPVNITSYFPYTDNDPDANSTEQFGAIAPVIDTFHVPQLYKWSKGREKETFNVHRSLHPTSYRSGWMTTSATSLFARKWRDNFRWAQLRRPIIGREGRYKWSAEKSTTLALLWTFVALSLLQFAFLGFCAGWGAKMRSKVRMVLMKISSWLDPSRVGRSATFYDDRKEREADAAAASPPREPEDGEDGGWPSPVAVGVDRREEDGFANDWKSTPPSSTRSRSNSGSGSVDSRSASEVELMPVEYSASFNNNNSSMALSTDPTRVSRSQRFSLGPAAAPDDIDSIATE